MSLQIVPISLAVANDFVNQLHRHHKHVQVHKFSLGCVKNGVLVGVSIVGRPCARKRDDGQSAEVSRLCTDGTRNACSALYAASARSAKAMGFWRIGTYILESELGTSLKASGWHYTHTTTTDGAGWAKPNASPKHGKPVYAPLEKKRHFELQFKPELVPYELPQIFTDLQAENEPSLFGFEALTHEDVDDYKAKSKPNREALVTADHFRD